MPTLGSSQLWTPGLSGVPWQRGQFHPMKNALAFLAKPPLKLQMFASLRAVFDAPDRPEAERQLEIAVKKYRNSIPKLTKWLEVIVLQVLAILALPAGHWRRLRTSKCRNH